MKSKIWAIYILIIFISSCAGIQVSKDVPEDQTYTERIEVDPAPVPLGIDIEDNSSMEAAEDNGSDENTSIEPVGDEAPADSSGLVIPENSQEPTATVTTTPERYMHPELTEKQLLFQGALALSDDVQPVSRDEGPVYLYADLDGNLLGDIAFLCVKAGDDINASWESLSDYARLYNKEKQLVEFFLYPFYQTNGTIIAGEEIFIRRENVIGGTRIVPLHTWYSLPKALSFRFPTLDGINEEWIIFTGNRGFSRFTLKERPNTHFHVDDIDGDGYYEIIQSEKLYEEGRGYETFISWLRWVDKGFQKYRHINVVRNLRGFMEQSRSAIMEYDAEKFADTALGGYDGSIILLDDTFWDRVFVIEEGPAENSELIVKQEKLFSEIINEKEIVSIYFPEVMENPFELSKDIDPEFPILIRVASKDGENYYFSGKIKMLKNPFGEKQFSFVLD